MNTNNSFGDKAPFVALWETHTYAVQRTFWSLDLVHARRAAKAWGRKHNVKVVWVKHAQHAPRAT